MKIEYTARKVNLRDNFKEKVEKKLKKFSKMFSDDATAKVTVTVEKNRQTVEITIKDKSMFYRSESVCREMNEALDKAVSNLARQIRKNKTRLEKKLHSKALSDFVVSNDIEEYEDEETEYSIVRTKEFSVSNMTQEEAILQMNMLDHSFFVFNNAITGRMNVVYLRKDGGYGILEPKE